MFLRLTQLKKNIFFSASFKGRVFVLDNDSKAPLARHNSGARGVKLDESLFNYYRAVSRIKS